ncbi:efflux RND transporter periplasmic adaptor subunit [bacterium]|nr:efflux RND transporter periplasmic adaptor subunit [bacterium]
MKKIIPVILVLLLLLAGGIYAYKQANTLILQGEAEVKNIDLASKVTGRVKKINIKKGDKVKKGDVLIELDTPEVNAKAEQSSAAYDLAAAQQLKAINGTRQEQLAMAKSGYEFAKKTYERLERLYNEGVIPAQKLDEAKAKYDAAKDTYQMALNGTRYEDKLSAAANVKRAKGAVSEVNSYLKEDKIIAPIDGTVTELTVEEAELVGAGYPIVTIADETDNWITFNIREDLLSKLKLGTVFEVKIPALGKEPIKVKVNYISVMGNFATWRATKAKGDFDMKTFEVRAVPLEPVNDLRSGMSAVFDWKKLK